jgi:malate dehydrogenase (oxaloacetate-decarboxylating)
VDKRIEDVRIVVSGVGAAGNAIIRLLLAQGAGEIIGCGRGGAVHAGQEGLDQYRDWIATHTNSTNLTGSLKEVLVGADVFIGVSASNLLTGDDIATMAADAIVFALANPVPEVDAVAASEHAAVVATGRSDYPNQINNVLAFPGFFRGLLDAGVSDITDEMLIAAAKAIADTVHPDQLNPSYIVPSVFDATVAPAVAAAVRAVATSGG